MDRPTPSERLHRKNNVKAILFVSAVLITTIVLGYGCYFIVPAKKVKIDLPHSKQRFQLVLRIPFAWYVERGEHDVNLNPSVFPHRIKRLLKEGGDITALYDNWVIPPGVAIISHRTNPSNLPIELYAKRHVVATGNRRVVSKKIWKLPEINGTKRIVLQIDLVYKYRMERWTILYLYKNGYEGICEVLCISEDETPKRVLYNQRVLIKSAYIE